MALDMKLQLYRDSSVRRLRPHRAAGKLEAVQHDKSSVHSGGSAPWPARGMAMGSLRASS